MKKNKINWNWKIHLIILIVIQLFLFGYARLIKGYNLSWILMILSVISFGFLVKNFWMKWIYTFIFVIANPLFLMSLFKLEVFIENILFILVILIITLGIGIINWSLHEIYTKWISKKISKQKKKIFIIAVVSFSIFLILYALLSLLSNDCISDSKIPFTDFKRCECDGFKLSSFFSDGACIGECINCVCGYSGKIYYEYDCAYFGNKSIDRNMLISQYAEKK